MTAPPLFPERIRHCTAMVAGLQLFYREAGSPGAPVVVLLHGFPSSSHMYRNLMPRLAGQYRVIAPDLPGFGLSAMPPATAFAYTFARFAEIVDALLAQLGAVRYALYVMDYGAPVGLRLACAHPERVTALIVQNGNAYEAGMGDFWPPRARCGPRTAPPTGTPCAPFSRWTRRASSTWPACATRPRSTRPAWVHDQYFLDRPGSADIQLDIIRDYRTRRRAVSGIPPLFSRLPAACADPVGRQRPDLPAGRRARVPARSAAGGAAPVRHGPFRARRQGARDGPADAAISRAPRQSCLTHALNHSLFKENDHANQRCNLCAAVPAAAPCCSTPPIRWCYCSTISRACSRPSRIVPSPTCAAMSR